MTINQRVKKLRTLLSLTQAQFAAQIFISNGYLADIELGNRNVTIRILKLICLVFNVQEEWLNTGNGEIFKPDVDPIVEQAVSTFAKLNPEFKEYVLKQMDALLELQNQVIKK